MLSLHNTKPMPATVQWVKGKVRLLDQTRLPDQVRFLECADYQSVARAIRNLNVRGAPAIGITAAMGLALGAKSIRATNAVDFRRQFQKICDVMAATRPTAVNLFWAIERMKKVVADHFRDSLSSLQDRLIQEAIQILEEDIETNRTIGEFGADLIKTDTTVLTHCNAGALATGGHGTALGVIRTATQQGKRLNVMVDETRPILQGARLTAWELNQDKIPVTLITDNMAGAFMKKKQIDLCIVGADRIAANGDTANKIGTYSLAVLARHHHIPFYVAAPTSTIDLDLATGGDIPIEERDPEEVTHILGQTRIAPKGIQVSNPAFDVTPARLITAIITEKGTFRPAEIRRLSRYLTPKHRSTRHHSKTTRRQGRS
jgi:methylthioribose-1-phosphate isomerase